MNLPSSIQIKTAVSGAKTIVILALLFLLSGSLAVWGWFFRSPETITVHLPSETVRITDTVYLQREVTRYAQTPHHNAMLRELDSLRNILASEGAESIVSANTTATIAVVGARELTTSNANVNVRYDELRRYFTDLEITLPESYITVNPSATYVPPTPQTEPLLDVTAKYLLPAFSVGALTTIYLYERK